jgi:hypothetical protein
MSNQMTFEDLLSAISSPESAGGVTPSDLQDGRTTDPVGQEARPANHSATPESGKLKLMPDTSGQCSSISSASASLQTSLENRLKQQLEPAGSMIYKMTWKQKVTPRGRSYCQLVASAATTSDKEFGLLLNGWPTPTTRDHKDGQESNVPTNSLLGREVWLAGLPTPTANKITPQTREDFTPNLAARAELAGWGTPAVSDDNNSRMSQEAMEKEWNRPGGSHSNLAKQTAINLTQNQPMRLKPSGEILTGYTAEMESGGQLNPAHSRWLMGYPAEWDYCGAMAMQSCRKSRRK